LDKQVMKTKYVNKHTKKETRFVNTENKEVIEAIKKKLKSL